MRRRAVTRTGAMKSALSSDVPQAVEAPPEAVPPPPDVAPPPEAVPAFDEEPPTPPVAVPPAPLTGTPPAPAAVSFAACAAVGAALVRRGVTSRQPHSSESAASCTASYALLALKRLQPAQHAILIDEHLVNCGAAIERVVVRTRHDDE